MDRTFTPIPTRGLLTGAAALTAALALAIAEPAKAAFPGRDGQIAFSSGRGGGGDTEIYVMSAGGFNQTRLTDNSLYDREPAFSADGRKIAFVQTYQIFGSDIYVMDADGSNETRLTEDVGTQDQSPAFSPDGTKIVFSKTTPGSLSDIYVMDADGSNQTRLTTGGGANVNPRFSPDGTKIVFSSDREPLPADEGDFEIYVMGSGGDSNVTRLTNNDREDFHPDFSPGGGSIAFQALDTDNSPPDESGIYVMPANGGSETGITPGGNDTPAFSPDGGKIVFSSFRPPMTGDNNIYVKGLGLGETQLTDASAGDEQPDWGPAVNQPPTANAGPGQTVDSEASVTLDGSGSTDPDGDALDYGWSQLSGTPVTPSGANTATPDFTAPVGPATLQFELEVCDPEPLCDTDTVLIMVNDPVVKIDGSAAAKKTQKQKGKKIVVKAKVKAKEDLTAKATGKVKVNPTYKLQPQTKSVSKGRSKNLKLKPKKSKDAKKIAKALKKGKKATAKLKVKLTDEAGNKKTKKLKVKLKR